MTQKIIDEKTIGEKYDKVSKLTTLNDRRKFFVKQSEELGVALWHKNIAEKTQNLDLSTEQKEIIGLVKDKFITVEFAKSVRGKTELEASEEYHEIMTRAKQLLGDELFLDLFLILGSSDVLEPNMCGIKRK